MACVQVTIEGSGTAVPTTVKIPGYISKDTPGVLFDIWNKPESEYPTRLPGPLPFVDSGSGVSPRTEVTITNTTTTAPGQKDNELKVELKDDELRNKTMGRKGKGQKDNELKVELKDNELKDELKDNELKGELKDSELKDELKDNEPKDELKDKTKGRKGKGRKDKGRKDKGRKGKGRKDKGRKGRGQNYRTMAPIPGDWDMRRR